MVVFDRDSVGGFVGAVAPARPSDSQVFPVLLLKATNEILPEDAVTVTVVETAVVLPTVALSATDVGLTLRVCALASAASKKIPREVRERTFFKV